MQNEKKKERKKEVDTNTSSILEMMDAGRRIPTQFQF